MAYIPEKHKGFGLLPRSVEGSKEVFSYPSSLIEEIEGMLFELEGVAEDPEYGRLSLLIPYGRESYDAYQAEIGTYLEKYSKHEVAGLLKLLSSEIRKMNVKEDWSVVRYVGQQFDGDDLAPPSRPVGATTGPARGKTQFTRASSTTRNLPRTCIRATLRVGK